MRFTAKQIAEVLNGTVEGNPDIEIKSVSKIDDGQPKTLTFLANPKYTGFIYTTKASVVIVGNDFTPEQPVSATLIRVENPYASFAKLLEIYNQIQKNKTGISKHAFISESACLGENCYVGEFAVISDNVTLGNHVKVYPGVFVGENVKVGDNTTIYAGVRIYSDNVIGADCTLHSGVIVGGDGFGFAPQEDNNYLKVAQIGNVILEDHVEIGANTTIDRATLGSTIIRKGAKLDNLIQVAHNVEIGENTVIAGQTGISGSTKIGKNCMIGGQVGIIGHLTIGDNVKIAAQSGIGADLPDDSIVQGSPAFDIRKYRKTYIHFRNLDDIVKRINELERKLK